MEKIAINKASFFYTVSILRLLRRMELISDEEYNRIIAISAEHYGTKRIYCT